MQTPSGPNRARPLMRESKPGAGYTPSTQGHANRSKKTRSSTRLLRAVRIVDRWERGECGCGAALPDECPEWRTLCPDCLTETLHMEEL